MKKIYTEPNIKISKVYTKVGDKGKTHLIGGAITSKDDIRVISYGEIDELNVLVGCCIFHLNNFEDLSDIKYLSKRLTSIQNELFNLGTVLASIGYDSSLNLPKIDNEDILLLESDIDKMNNSLDPLDSFVLPGGNELTLYIHLSRVVCRRAERSVVSVINKYADTDIKILEYLNRLSDYFFVLGRWITYSLDIDENLWNPNNISSNNKL